jgi:ABC-type nitrate/sulfonate/bicarbonate transport system permease component
MSSEAGLRSRFPDPIVPLFDGAPPLELPIPDSGPLRRFIDRFGRPLFVLAEAFAFLAIWELITSGLKLVNPVFLPPPSEIIGALYRFFVTEGTIYEHLQFSATTWFTGYTLAALLGIGIGLLMGTFEPVGRLISPLAWSLYATPHISLRPMFVIWFGFGPAPIIALVFISAFFPILLTSSAGVTTADPTLLRAGQVFGANRLQLYLKVVLPSTVPFIVAGMRLAIPTSIIGMVVGEILGSGLGIGAVLALGAAKFHVEEAFAAIVILVTASLSLLAIFGRLEKKLAPWREQSTMET